jgi:hypothetical protein
VDIHGYTGQILASQRKRHPAYALKRERPGADTPGQFDRRAISSLISDPSPRREASP